VVDVGDDKAYSVRNKEPAHSSAQGAFMSRFARFALVVLTPVFLLGLLFLRSASGASSANVRYEAPFVLTSQTPPGPFYLPLILHNFSRYPFTLQNGSPFYLANFANTAGCKWQGIAGQVFDLNGRPVIGLLVHLEGGGLNVDTLTGSKPEYGQSGYEFFLTDQPQTTTDTYRIQLRTTSGVPLSEFFFIPTFAECTKNLALVNFVQLYATPTASYTLQEGHPAYIANFANTAGCNWMGLAGQVFDLNGRPQIGLVVHLEGGGLISDTLTGSKLEYGPSGYEFVLGDHPVQTTNTYIIQLRNSAGMPLSGVYVIPTFAECNKNLILVSFVQNH